MRVVVAALLLQVACSHVQMEESPVYWAEDNDGSRRWWEEDLPRVQVPPEPFPGQRTPPCETSQHEIGGGCWGTYGGIAPCAYGYFEHEGRCYEPVAVAQRPGTSIEE